jgi:hypothetical protein
MLPDAQSDYMGALYRPTYSRHPQIRDDPCCYESSTMTMEDTIFDETGAVAYIRSRAVFSAKTEKIVAFVRGKDLFDLLDRRIGSLSELGPVGSTLPEGLKKLLD